jgi:CelD/BcsL family acetyltransferase involved in cellulose biosynthesis
LREAFAIEAAGWEGRSGSALACDALRQKFFRSYAAAACRRGALRMGFLRVGERPIAMQLGVEAGGRFWLLKMGYDEAFARCSPGTLLMREMIARAAAEGLASFELLGITEPWTRMWTRLERPCVSLRAYPASPRGLAALASDAVVVSGRRLGAAVRSSDERLSAKRVAGLLGAVV